MKNVNKGLGKKETGETELVHLERRKTKACIDDSDKPQMKMKET